MFIMTENGYRPLVSFEAYWTKKRDAIEQAKSDVSSALAMTCKNDDERQARHFNVMRAYSTLSKVRDEYFN